MLVKIVWSIVYIAAYSASPDDGRINGTTSGTHLTYYSSKERCEAAAAREADQEIRDHMQIGRNLVYYQYACVPHREGYSVGLDVVPENETWQLPERTPLPERKPVR